MCGIAGIINENSRERRGLKGKIKRMTDSIAHRGPNGEGFFVDEKMGIALGHRRLSILDLSLAGKQPMPDDSEKLWIIFNGEIYNYVELKKELQKKHKKIYKSGTDTEVLLHAYAAWGKNFLEKLNGIFAFAIWDEKKKILFCARDHVGVKPFYYALQNGVFYFASEIKALLEAGVKTSPNDKIIYDYLVLGVYEHSEETFFSNIYKLPPGHYLSFESGKIKISRYWNLPQKVFSMDGWSEKKIKKEMLALLEDAVRIQLRSDVPISINVSGGLDSSILAYLVDKICKGQRNFRLFSFGYGNSKYDEAQFVSTLARKLGWQEEFTHLLPKDVIRLAPLAVYHQDEPFPGLPSLALQRLVESHKSENMPVILEGQGGDEIEAGYEYYIGPFILDLIESAGSAKAFFELEKYGELHGFTNEQTSRFFMGSLGAYFAGGVSADASSFVKPHVLKKDFLRTAKNVPLEFESPFYSHLSNMQYRDIFYTKLPRILRSCDRASMAYGRELRVPFLDKRLVEFFMSLPMRYKIQNGEQRFLLREVFRKVLPKDVVNASKRAVANPQREWFAKELKNWVEPILSSKSFAQRPYFDQDEVLKEYKKYLFSNGRRQNSYHIWQWINMELWLRTFFD